MRTTIIKLFGGFVQSSYNDKFYDGAQNYMVVKQFEKEKMLMCETGSKNQNVICKDSSSMLGTLKGSSYLTDTKHCNKTAYTNHLL